MSTMDLEIEFVELCREVITSLDHAKKNSSRKAAIRRLLQEQQAWSPLSIEKRMWQ